MSMADEFAQAQAEREAREQAEKEEREQRDMALNHQREEQSPQQPAYEPNHETATMNRAVLDRNQQAALAQQIEKVAPEMDGGEREQAALEMQQRIREQQEREQNEPER